MHICIHANKESIFGPLCPSIVCPQVCSLQPLNRSQSNSERCSLGSLTFSCLKIPSSHCHKCLWFQDSSGGGGSIPSLILLFCLPSPSFFVVCSRQELTSPVPLPTQSTCALQRTGGYPQRTMGGVKNCWFLLITVNFYRFSSLFCLSEQVLGQLRYPQRVLWLLAVGLEGIHSGF